MEVRVLSPAVRRETRRTPSDSVCRRGTVQPYDGSPIWPYSGSIRTGSVSHRGRGEGRYGAETWFASRAVGRSRRRPGFEIDRSGLFPARAPGADRRIPPGKGAPADDRAGNRLAGTPP